MNSPTVWETLSKNGFWDLEADDSSDEEDLADPMLSKRIMVYWTGMRCWFAGVVVGTQRERGRRIHEVHYEADNVRCWHKLDGAGAVKWKPAPPRKGEASEAAAE